MTPQEQAVIDAARRWLFGPAETAAQAKADTCAAILILDATTAEAAPQGKTVDLAMLTSKDGGVALVLRGSAEDETTVYWRRLGTVRLTVEPTR